MFKLSKQSHSVPLLLSSELRKDLNLFRKKRCCFSSRAKSSRDWGAVSRLLPPPSICSFFTSQFSLSPASTNILSHSHFHSLVLYLSFSRNSFSLCLLIIFFLSLSIVLSDCLSHSRFIFLSLMSLLSLSLFLFLIHVISLSFYLFFLSHFSLYLPLSPSLSLSFFLILSVSLFHPISLFH